MREIVRKMIEYTSENLKVVTAMVSMISLIITGLFKALTYLYCRGQHDFWNIPANYITIDYQNILFKFLLMTVFVILIIGICTIYTYYFKKIKEKNRGIKKFLKLTCMIFAIPCFSIFIMAWYIIVEFSIGEMLDYMNNDTSDFLVTILIFSILIGLLLFSIGQWGFYLYDEEKQEDKQEKSKPKTLRKTPKQWLVIGVIFLVSAIGLLGYTVYDTGKSSCLGEVTVNVVDIKNKSFVIVDQYNDKWILKECILENDEVIINLDSYIIDDIIGNNILIKRLPDGKSLQDCLVNDETYKGMLDK